MGAPLLSPAHDFLNGELRAAWIADPDGNPIQVVQRDIEGRTAGIAVQTGSEAAPLQVKPTHLPLLRTSSRRSENSSP